MKTRKVIISMMIMVFAFSSIQIMAQGKKMDKKGHAFKNLELTVDQQTKAETLKLDLHNKMMPMNLDVKEKQVQLEKLMIADKPDEKAIMSKIDEISKIRTDIQKLKVSNRLKFRALLNPEQKAKFDLHQMNNGGKKTRAPRNKGEMHNSMK